MPEPIAADGIVLIATHGLGRRFGGICAVDAVSLRIAEGGCHAIIGPNGAGKSTLLAMLSGELAPSEGCVVFRGRDITHIRPERLARLGAGRTYQRPSVFARFTTRDCVRLAVLGDHAGWRDYLKPFRRVDQTAADAALARVGIAARGDVAVEALSHGERRRLELAMVLASDPAVLLLDEPLAGLGPDESRQIVALLAGLKKGHTLVLIEHDMDAVFDLADRISVLDNGRLIATGTPAEIRCDPAVRRAYLGESTPAALQVPP